MLFRSGLPLGSRPALSRRGWKARRPSRGLAAGSGHLPGPPAGRAGSRASVQGCHRPSPSGLLSYFPPERQLWGPSGQRSLQPRPGPAAAQPPSRWLALSLLGGGQGGPRGARWARPWAVSIRRSRPLPSSHWACSPAWVWSQLQGPGPAGDLPAPAGPPHVAARPVVSRGQPGLLAPQQKLRLRSDQSPVLSRASRSKVESRLGAS